ncbi:MAG: isochorismatase hydrolase [Chthoniobacteraceae bacterium]|nr:isochorismatase hydrolase [Chthoniobacteraceae bacterium]
MKPRHSDEITPERSELVLLLVDVINDLDFPEGQKLLRFALPAARRIAALKKRLRKRGIPAIYVNDNFGRWRSDFKQQVERCLSNDVPGAAVARLLIPSEDDYFVLKPKYSGFFSTSLDILLKSIGARKLIITGFAADICVLFTANDAYMRDYEVIVPSDCIASETATARRGAIHQMKRFLKADIRSSPSIQLRQKSA